MQLHCSVCGESGEGDFACRCIRARRYAESEQRRIIGIARMRQDYVRDPAATLDDVARLYLARGVQYEIVSVLGAREPLFLITELPAGLV